LLYLVGYLHRYTKMMHGHTNIKFINTKQAKGIHCPVTFGRTDMVKI